MFGRQGRQSWWVVYLLACVSEWNGQNHCTFWHGHYWLIDWTKGQGGKRSILVYTAYTVNLKFHQQVAVQYNAHHFVSFSCGRTAAVLTPLSAHSEILHILTRNVGSFRHRRCNTTFYPCTKHYFFYPCSFSYLLVALSGWKGTTVRKYWRPFNNPCPHMYFHSLEW